MCQLSFLIILLLVIACKLNCLYAEEEICPQIEMGGGYVQSRKYCGGVLQMEYKFGRVFWHHLRPQMTLLFSQYCSGYVGLGLGWEYYLTKQIMIIPSFSPGYYWRGKGRDLGCPLEFRSAIECAFEMENKIRIGFQVAHVSNAHLSNRNPGLNTYLLSVALPLNKF